MVGQKKPVSLRRRLYDAKRQMRERLIAEQAFQLARGAQVIEVNLEGMFQHLDYDELMSVGVTRKDAKGRTIRVTGEEAVELQIKAIKARGNKSVQSQRFKRNYLESMRQVGYTEQEIMRANTLLNSISQDALTLLYSEGKIPSIEYTYANDSKKDTLDKLESAVQNLDKQKVKEIRERAKGYREILRGLAK